MRVVNLLCAAAALCAASPVMAQTVIDFSGVPTSPFASYTQSGATITAVGGGLLSSTSSSPNGTRALIGANAGGLYPELRASFATEMSSVSIDLGDFGGDSDLAFLEVFNGSNSLIGSTSLLLANTDMSMHTLTLTGLNIRSAVFGGRAPGLAGSSLYADNLTFRQSVPEPATWAMMLIGFGAIGSAVRRKRERRIVQSV